MNFTIKILPLLLFTFYISSCATMIHGSKQKVPINSTPQSADVRINKLLVGTTPLIEIDESKISPDLSNTTLFYPKNISAENTMHTYNKENRRIRWDSLKVRHERTIRLEEQARWMKAASKDSLLQIKRVEQKIIRSTFKHELSWGISYLITRELNFSYLRYFKNSRFAAGIELGYKPAFKHHTTYSNIDILDVDGPSNKMMYMPFTESKYIAAVGKMNVLRESIAL